MNKELNDLYNEFPEIKRRNDESYTIIEKLEKFEFTHYLTYELARREKTVDSIFNMLDEMIEFYCTKMSSKVSTLEIVSKVEYFYNLFIENLNLFEKENQYKELLTSQNSNFHIIFKIFIETFERILYNNYYIIYFNKNKNPEYSNHLTNIHNPFVFVELENEYSKHIENNVQYDMTYNSNTLDNREYDIGENQYFTSYQEVNIETKKFTFNVIYPEFRIDMKKFLDTKIAVNLNLPKSEILDFVEKIKDNYDSSNPSIKSVYEILATNSTFSITKLRNMEKKDWADCFFIYDYISKSKDKNNETKYQKLKEIFILEYGYLVKKTEREIKEDKKKRDNSNYKLISYNAFNKNKEKYDERKAQNKNAIKPYLTADAIRKKFEFMSQNIKNLTYKKILCGKNCPDSNSKEKFEKSIYIPDNLIKEI